MRVLVLGGTGSIGGPVVRELTRRGHEVIALARSDASAGKLRRIGAMPLEGDISSPERWLASLPPLDAVIHAAAAFSTDDEATELRLLQALLPYLGGARRNTRFIYTGGCWLFGANDGTIATEDSPYDPLPAFAWSLPHIQLVLGAPDIHPIVIHPAMVYEPTGGVFARFYADAVERRAIRIVAGEHIRWPLVHTEDLAALYRLALEDGPSGETYIGAAIDGMAVGRIARAFAQRFRTPHPDPEVISPDQAAAELGEWARGCALDQLQSGDKARRRLGWTPLHQDPEREIASIT